MLTDPYPPPSDPVEEDVASFPGAHVVQRIAGRPDAAGAEVATLYAATVTLNDDRVAAVVGQIEWTWLFADIEAVFHGGDQPWTIFAVPGIDDHGVAVGWFDAAVFRRRLEALLPTTIPVHQRPTGPAGTAGPARSGPGAGGARDAQVLNGDLRRSPPVGAMPVEDPEPVASPRREPVAPPPSPPNDDTGWVRPVGAMPVPDREPGTVGPAVQVAPPPTRPADDVTRPISILGPSPTQGTGRRGHHGGPLAPQPLAGLEARDVTAWFGAHLVLDRVSLDMAAGRVTALIGPSGCGKSTFLRVLNRMHELIPSAALAGEVLLDGADIYDPSRKVTDARRQIGMVFQKPNPFPAMSIYDNVLAGLQLTGAKVSTQAKDEMVESCLRKAGLWNEVRDRLRQPGGSLSGGQQQRLCIARALAIRPRVLLMDEPCSALDPTSTRRIEQTIAELKTEVTIVIVTHNMQQAARVSDHCAFFLAEQNTPGVIVEHGPTDAMFQAPQDVRTSDYVNGRFG